MYNTINMTRGNIKKQMIAYTIPIIISLIFQQLYNIADSIIVGRFIGTEAFAAVGIAGTVMNLFIFIISGFCVGTTILLSRYWGGNNLKEFNVQFFTSITWGTIFTAIITTLSIILINPLLESINTPLELMTYTQSYLRIIFLGLITTFLYNIFNALFKSIGNSRISLMFLIVSMIVNIFLDLLFIITLDLGIQGAALATIISQGFSALCCIVYAKFSCPFIKATKKHLAFSSRHLKDALSYGAISSLHQSVIYLGKLLIQTSVNSLGTDAISAYTAINRIEAFILATGNGFCDTISVFVSQNIGSKKEERAKKGFTTGMSMVIIYGLLISIVMLLGARTFLSLFLNKGDTEAMALGLSYFKILSFLYSCCFIADSFTGYFRGTGNLKIPFICSVTQLSVRVIFTVMFIERLQLSAVALGTALGWIILNSIQFAFYRQCKPYGALKSDKALRV